MMPNICMPVVAAVMGPLNLISFLMFCNEGSAFDVHLRGKYLQI